MWTFYVPDCKQAASTQFIHTHELYEHCLTFLSPPGTSSVQFGALARLARTSKATSDLALDTLWRTLFSPSPILRLLPPDACELIRNTTHVLKRPLVEADFGVFDKYAHRVRTVDFSSFTTIRMGCDLFPSLKVHRDPIFPRLLEMRWHPSVKFNTVGAFHLLSRALPAERFSLTIWGGDLTPSSQDAAPPDTLGVAALVTEPLSSWIPDVRALDLHTGLHYLSAGNILGGLQALTNLQHIAVNFALGPEILAHLARLPQLLSLYLWEEDEKCTHALQQTLTDYHQTFPALEKLYSGFRPCESRSLSILLALITSDALHTVIFTLGNRYPVEASFLHLITGPDAPRSLARRNSLRHIEVLTTPPEPGTPPLPTTLLDPLYACPNLRTVRVRGAIPLASADIERMASSWPSLESLDAHTGLDPVVPLHSLSALAARCPCLREISIAVDARAHTGPVTHPPSYAVTTLHLFGSPLARADIDPVVQFLNHAFPRLSVFYGSMPPPAGDGIDLWGVVKQALPEVDWEYRQVMREAIACSAAQTAEPSLTNDW
ncbi:hypothetical protein FB451DRAFT_1371408 [Mycena latifolia]|nr:hypothetical protein FB451DRAFT_1371408 [Mycena latifolia]